MSKYLIEVDDTAVDDRAGELIQRMIDEGYVQISSPHWNLPVKVVGKATWTEVGRLPDNIRVAVVEPLA